MESFYLLVGWLCFTTHRQRGILETAPPFTVPFEEREARFSNRSHRESNPGPSRGSPVALPVRHASSATFIWYSAPWSSFLDNGYIITPIKWTERPYTQRVDDTHSDLYFVIDVTWFILKVTSEESFFEILYSHIGLFRFSTDFQ